MDKEQIPRRCCHILVFKLALPGHYQIELRRMQHVELIVRFSMQNPRDVRQWYHALFCVVCRCFSIVRKSARLDSPVRKFLGHRIVFLAQNNLFSTFELLALSRVSRRDLASLFVLPPNKDRCDGTIFDRCYTFVSRVSAMIHFLHFWAVRSS